MEKIKKKKKILKTYIYIKSTLVAQLWDAGDISNCQLLLVRLRQQGEPESERGCKAGEGRRIFADQEGQHLRCALLPFVQQFFQRGSRGWCGESRR